MTRRTRWNELLDVPNEVKHPDLYQIVGMERRSFDPAKLEEAVRERMSRLQRTRSTKHKEFIEYAKGELRRARRILGDTLERNEYDRELLLELEEDLRRIIGPVLACGHFVRAAEEAILRAGLAIGLSEAEVQVTLEVELSRVAPAPEPPPPPKRLVLPEGVSIEGVAAEPVEPAPLPRVATPEAIQRVIRRWGEPPAEREARRKLRGSTPSLGILRPSAGEPATPEPVTSSDPGRRCGACARAIPDRWREMAAAERIGTRLLCSVCAAAVHGNEACATCSKRLGPLDGVVWTETVGRVCEECAARVTRLKVCARCDLVLPPVLFERHEAHSLAGRHYCLECFRVVAT